MKTDALLSADGRYRYHLTRTWGEGRRCLTFVMLNPSTADAEVDDPTIRRCIGFAQREGFDSLAVVNLYAFRATDPKEMRRAINPVGSDNDDVLRRTFTDAADAGSPVVVAWGAGADAWRVREVKRLMGDAQVFSLGTTKDGHPKHPLYIRGDQPLIPWPATADIERSIA